MGLLGLIIATAVAYLIYKQVKSEKILVQAGQLSEAQRIFCLKDTQRRVDQKAVYADERRCKELKRIKEFMRDNMRNLVICCLILLALASNCEAATPVQLSGNNG